jgi:hypothetical protein
LLPRYSSLIPGTSEPGGPESAPKTLLPSGAVAMLGP